MEDHKFGEQLKQWRKKAGLTQKQLGELAGVGQVVIANYERGARFPGEETLRHLAEALNVSLDILLSISLNDSENRLTEVHNLDSLFDLFLNKQVNTIWDYIKSWKKSSKLETEDIYSDILIPLLHKTGDLWFSGELSIIDEHLISGKVREIITLAAADDERWSHTAVEGKKWMGLCAPGDQHDIALLMTARLLQLKGWNTRFIGVDTPITDLINSVKRFRPDVLCFSVTLDSFIQGLETYLKVLYENRKNDFAVIIGGAAADDSLKKLPGFWANAQTLHEGIDAAERYLINKRSVS